MLRGAVFCAAATLRAAHAAAALMPVLSAPMRRCALRGHACTARYAHAAPRSSDDAECLCLIFDMLRPLTSSAPPSHSLRLFYA